LIVPAELIKARMQTQAFSTIGHCLRDAISKERGGLLGLYTGYTATMIRDLPYFALQLGFYGVPIEAI
jgi:Mitochondrial carrier protein